MGDHGAPNLQRGPAVHSRGFRLRVVTWIAAAALVLPALAHGDSYLQAEPHEVSLEGADHLRLQYPAGVLAIEGDEGTTVRMVVRVDCKEKSYDDCQDEVRRLRVEHRVSGRTLVIELQGVRKQPNGHHVEIDTHVLVPRRLAARVEMGFGELRIDGMAADLDVELGVGNLQLRADSRRFREAQAAAGVGEATIRTPSGTVRERGFIGHEANWDEGRGMSSIHAHVGVGSARVTIE